MDNQQVAQVFFEMADLVSLTGGDPYRSRAFKRIGRVVETLPENVNVMLTHGTLEKVPGIGDGALHRIKEILRTGSCVDHRRLAAQFPVGLRDLMKIHGIGPRALRVIYSHLRLGTVEQVDQAARAGLLVKLPGVNWNLQQKLIEGIAALKVRPIRVPLGDALPIGMELVAHMRKTAGVVLIELTGSARRRKESIEDLDVLVGSNEGGAIVRAFTTGPLVQEVLLAGEGRASVRLKGGGMQADLRVIAPETWGAGLHYFTGSKDHNVAIRLRGHRMGLKISDHGVFDRDTEVRVLAARTEEEIFSAVKLPWIPPELRENMGEIEAAERGMLPRLIDEDEVKGDLHMHTTASDGSAIAADMARIAIQQRLEYIAITDHSYMVGPHLKDQMQHLRGLEDKLGELRLLAGCEVDIEADGQLELPLEVLAGLDWVVASVHGQMDQPPDAMTQRLIRAIESGVVDCIGHPTGRQLRGRDPYGFDVERVFEAARKHHVAMEINGNPNRLDLNAQMAQTARNMGVAILLNSDAHSPAHLAHRTLAVYTARRGWLEARDILNTQPVETLLDRRRDRLLEHGFTLAAASRTRAKPTRKHKKTDVDLTEVASVADSTSSAPAPPASDADAEAEAYFSTAANDLAATLRAGAPFDATLTARLARYLEAGEDDILHRALSAMSDNPLQAAFNLHVQAQATPEQPAHTTTKRKPKATTRKPPTKPPKPRA